MNIPFKKHRINCVKISLLLFQSTVYSVALMLWVLTFWDRILTLLFQPFVAGCDQSGWCHMAGESASLSLAVMPVTVSLVKLCPSLSIVECFVFCRM
jgi:hypothetical protein